MQVLWAPIAVEFVKITAKYVLFLTLCQAGIISGVRELLGGAREMWGYPCPQWGPPQHLPWMDLDH